MKKERPAVEKEDKENDVEGDDKSGKGEESGGESERENETRAKDDDEVCVVGGNSDDAGWSGPWAAVLVRKRKRK